MHERKGARLPGRRAAPACFLGTRALAGKAEELSEVGHLGQPKSVFICQEALLPGS